MSVMCLPEVEQNTCVGHPPEHIGSSLQLARPEGECHQICPGGLSRSMDTWIEGCVKRKERSKVEHNFEGGRLVYGSASNHDCGVCVSSS